MPFRINRSIRECPPGSGIYECTVTAVPDGSVGASAYASESCMVGSLIAAEVVASRMQAALAAKLLGDGNEVRMERDELTR